MDELRTTCWAFTAGADIRANATAISHGLGAASRVGAAVLLTPECGLCGYPSAARESLADCDWRLLADCERQLAEQARTLGILLVLGTAGLHGAGVTNQALACGAVAEQRYHKQCLTPTDLKHFVPGHQQVVVETRGWRLGLGICYDLRFPDVWMSLAQAGVDAFLVIAHMAGPDADPGTKRRLIPTLCATRASETASPLAFANTSAPDRYCDSGCWDARGNPLVTGHEGLIDAKLVHRSSLDPWYQGLHDTAIGRWRSARAH
jgi:predicted amidohydrolase